MFNYQKADHPHRCVNLGLENSTGKDGYWWIPKNIQDDLHPKIPKTNFFSSGYLLLSSCTLPKIVVFVQVQGT